MIGLLIVAIGLFVSFLSGSENLLLDFESWLPFLQNWYTFWCVVLFALTILAIIIGAGAIRSAAGPAMIVGGIIAAIGVGLNAFLLIGGVHFVDKGLQGGEVVDQQSLVIGAILWAIGILLSAANTSSANFSSSS